MADDPIKRSDHARINVDQDQDVQYWADQFGVTASEVRSAVELVGPSVESVRQRLAAHRSY